MIKVLYLWLNLLGSDRHFSTCFSYGWSPLWLQTKIPPKKGHSSVYWERSPGTRIFVPQIRYRCCLKRCPPKSNLMEQDKTADRQLPEVDQKSSCPGRGGTKNLVSTTATIESLERSSGIFSTWLLLVSFQLYCLETDLLSGRKFCYQQWFFVFYLFPPLPPTLNFVMQPKVAMFHRKIQPKFPPRQI